jgi:hypothetical protein
LDIYDTISWLLLITLKIADPNVWELKHRHVYAAHFGPIPEGCNIQFINGNRQDCRIENLYLISRHNQIKQNTIIRYPEDLRKAMLTIYHLNKAIKKAKQ